MTLSPKPAPTYMKLMRFGDVGLGFNTMARQHYPTRQQETKCGKTILTITNECQMPCESVFRHTVFRWAFKVQGLGCRMWGLGLRRFFFQGTHVDFHIGLGKVV